MDTLFTGAPFLVFATMGLTQLIKGTFPSLSARLIPAVCVAIGIVATFLVANSDWGDEQIVLKRSLGSANWESLLLVSILIGGFAATTYTVLAKAISNIGQNKEGSV